MSGSRHKSSKIERKSISKWEKIQKFLTWNFLIDLLKNPLHTMKIGWMLLTIEVFLNILIVKYIPYTEIDWRAYMQECEGFLNGTWDYKKLKGDTGPLVYPAGFVYLYSALYYLTSYGTNIRFAQYIFVVIYLFQLYLSLKIYAKTRKVPPYAIILVTLTSYRVHSLYALRLFNDPWAVLLFYGALHCFLNENWIWGSILYSLAVSVKMNILLYAPCLFFMFLTRGGILNTIKYISICAFVQLILGAPFLITNPLGYIEGSFDIRRIFEHQWTVNWRFLNRAIFENRFFHISLLFIHIIVLLIFLPLIWRYLNSYAKLKEMEKQIQPQLDKKPKKKSKQKGLSLEEQKFLDSYENELQQQTNKNFTVDFSTSTQLLVLPMFVVNLIGIACARSLHYQFYTWYYHSLLYLGWSTRFPAPVVLLLLAVLEACWNTYPSTVLSSAALHICHFLLVVGVYRNMRIATKSVIKKST